jgi:hypothetical protein
MIEKIYRLLLTFNATSPIIVTFLIKERYYICLLGKYPLWISYIIFILVPVILTFISLMLKRFLSKDSIECKVTDIEQANNEFLPSYLGYFFVALSVTSVETMVFIYGMLFVFTFVSQTLYFNPIFLCFGYHFYYIVTEENVKQFIITKKKLRSTKGLAFQSLRRINNFTYIDEEKGE